MSYISEIFDRANIQQIREFLLHGTGGANLQHSSYNQRLEETRKSAINKIKARFLDMEEYEPIAEELYQALDTCEEVYMEIGLQVGMMLAIQFMSGDSEMKY